VLLFLPNERVHSHVIQSTVIVTCHFAIETSLRACTHIHEYGLTKTQPVQTRPVSVSFRVTRTRTGTRVCVNACHRYVLDFMFFGNRTLGLVLVLVYVCTRPKTGCPCYYQCLWFILLCKRCICYGKSARPSICWYYVKMRECRGMWSSPLGSPVSLVSKLVPYSTTCVGHGANPSFLAVSMQVTLVINPVVGCRYFPPSPRLLFH